MADYQGLIRVGVQGLGEIRQLNAALERTVELYGNLENATAVVGQIGQSATRNVERAAGRRAQAGRDLARANQIVENTAQRRDPRTGRFLPGGPNATARRLAGKNERLAQREVLQADRALREELRNQRLVWAAQRRYAGALNNTADAIDGLQGQIGQEQARLEAALAGIARGSRGNYLTNLFQGRQAALARGGGGRNLSPNLQEQIRANRAAWDLATAGGRENLQLMSRLATELSGLVRQQNEFNRRRAVRSGTFEDARRAQERITELSQMPGADPARIRRLRAQATRANAAGFRGDAAETQIETRRMNASIARYDRELKAAARELQVARARGGPRLPIRGGANIQGSPAYIDRMARTGGARESIKGRKDLPGSPAYLEEQRKQLQRAIRTGGAREGVKGRKDLPGSPAYIEEQRKQLQRAIRAGGPKESVKGRKDLPGSPAYLEEQRKQQSRQLQQAIRAGGPRESVKGRKDLPGSPAYIEEQQKQLQRAIRAGGPRESAKGRKDLPGSPAYIKEQQKQQRQQLQRAIRAGGPKESIKGRKDLPGSPAYLEEQRKQQSRQLQQAIRAGGPKESIRGRKDLPGSPVYIEEQRKQLQRAIRAGGPKESVKGRKDLPGSPAYLEEQRKQQSRQLQQAIRAGGPREGIGGRKDLPGSPAYVEEQRKQLQRAIRAGGPKESIKGRKDLPGSPAYVEEQQRQLQRAIRAGGPKESIKGRKDVVGSPAYYEEQQKQLQRAIRAGGPREGIKGRKDLPGSPAYIKEQQEQQRQQLQRAIRAGGPKESIRGRKDLPGSPAYLEAEQKERERVARLRQIASPIRGTATMVGSPAYFEAQERLQRAQQVSRKLGPASPIRGTATMVGSPAYIAAQERLQKTQRQPQGFFRGDARKAIGEGLIGGAFPLLFGQGLGASIGGAVGGGFGGAIGGSFGFGLSLAGTAIGQAVDNTAANLKDLAAALKNPADAITALEASGFRVTDALKLQVQQLQSVGRAYDAQTLVLQEVQRRLGPGSLTELRQLDSAQKRLQEQYAAIGAEIQVRLLPVLQGFVEFLGIAAGDIGGFASQSRLQRLDPAKFEELRTQAIRESSTGPFGSLGNRNVFNATLSRLSKEELSRRFADERSRVPLSAEQKLEAETTRLNESRRIADQIQSAYREAFNLQRQAHDLQRDGADLNREIADYSYRKEREIFDLKQQAAEKQIENNRAAAQNRIERGDLGARQTFAAAVGFEQQLLTNVREVMRTRMEGEADIEQSRSRLELTMAKLNRDVEDYKRTNAREVEDIERRKLAYARSVEDYKMRVADYVLQRSRESADLMRQAMTLPDMSGGGGGAMGGTGPRGYFARLAELESSSGKNWTNPSSNARGFFQLIPKTEQWLKSVGKGDLAARLLSRDFAIASDAAKDFAIVMRPAAKGLIEAGDVAGLDRLLNRVWTSLPGGAEAATGPRLARANALLTPSATVGGNAMFGRTGRMSLREGYGMVDLRGSTREAIIADAADAIVNRASAGMRTWIGGGGGLDIEATNLRGQELIAALRQGMRAHETRGANPATAIDLIAKLGEPLGIPVGGISNRGGATGIAGTTARGTLALHLAPGSSGATAMQAMAAGQIGSISPPQFNPVPAGPTPSAAPTNAARVAVAAAMGGNEQQAQRILEDQIKLRQKGIEIGQIEQILQANQLPQLQQQGQALKLQIEARRKNLGLSDDAAAAVDIEAEGVARINQIEAERTAALSKVQKQYGNDLALVKQVNEQADLGVKIAKEEEKQRRVNLGLSNELQNAERVRSEILQLQEVLAAGRAEAAALERGELQATAVELLKASSLYQQASQAQKDKLAALAAETEELKKQNEFKRRINELDQDIRFTGAGLRAGFVGGPARAFEQGLKDFNGDIGKATDMANRTRLLEDQQATWGNLERNIVDVSNAISGGLTNGLLDIVDGARKIEDVGRDMLNGIARSFATSAEQQLTTLLQRQLGSLLGGAQGPLVKMLGAGGEVAGSQALGAASLAASSSLWSVSGAAAAAGVALQTIAAQAAFSGGLGSLGGIGQIFSGAAPNLFSKAIPDFIPSLAFGGFLANGGNTRPGEGYVVGENEPEFFFPGVSGRVVPRSDMQKAEELRQGSEQAEPIDLRYTVTEQQGERYVTEQQFRKGMEQTTKRAQAMTYAGMRNNREVRNFVDI